jgi:glyoxalase family protein
MQPIRGLHHVTAISGPAQENLDFYAGVLGMRLVKKSVNQDDPGTYHLFYADAAGTPGSDLTFFPWSQMAPARRGHGLATEVALTVPAGSLEFWAGRLDQYGVEHEGVEERFGLRTLPLVDPHRMPLTLTESGAHAGFEPWSDSPVPAEKQIRGLEGARAWEKELAPSESFLERGMGFVKVGEERGWHRWAAAPLAGDHGSGGWMDLRLAPSDAPRGAWGTGAIHHLAWRVDDSEHELAMRARVAGEGARPTPVIDRFWFQSVYFREPGGVLFELATDGPGFAVDESPEHLGESLVLPPWMEEQRAEIEAVLPKLEPAEAARV